MHTSNRSRSTAGALLALALLLAACGDAIAPGSGDDTSTSTFDGDWRLVRGETAEGPIALPEDTEVTLTIEGSSWGGRSHCNSYNGTVEVDGNRMEPQDVAVTEMACVDAALMEAEAAYLDAFLGSDDVSIDHGHLLLLGDGTELTYERLAPVEDAALEGTRWVLDALVEGTGEDGSVSSIPEPADGEGTESHLTFDGEQLGGFDLCNAFGGPYELEGDPSAGARLRVGELAGDGAGCPDAVGPANEHLLQVLRADEVELRIEGETLTLTAEDRGLVFRADG